MNITIFNRPYWIRRFGPQTEYKGYLSAEYTDMVVSLHVHPPGTEQVTALDEGERIVRRLEAHGTDGLLTSDQDTGQKGDLLYFKGHWYECRSAEDYDHTLLHHLNYMFILVPLDGSEPYELYDPPVGDPRDFMTTPESHFITIPECVHRPSYNTVPGSGWDEESTVSG